MSKHLFYFVRHGQSLLNERGIRQDGHGQLSDRGVEQAHITGERLAEEQRINGHINIIVASPYDRTRETADIINAHIKVKKPIEYSDLLIERRNPTKIIGQSIEDPEIRKIVDMIDHSYHGDDFRYADEENFADLRNRAAACLEFLERRHEKKVLVVTHGIFLKMLVAYMTHGDDLTSQEYNKLSFFNPSNNAGITVAQYSKGLFAPKHSERWRLLVWDDHIDLKGRNTII